MVEFSPRNILRCKQSKMSFIDNVERDLEREQCCDCADLVLHYSKLTF